MRANEEPPRGKNVRLLWLTIYNGLCGRRGNPRRKGEKKKVGTVLARMLYALPFSAFSFINLYLSCHPRLKSAAHALCTLNASHWCVLCTLPLGEWI